MSRPHRPPRSLDLSPGTAGVHRIRRALERAERDFVAEVVTDGGIGPWRRRVEARFSSAREVFAAAGLSGAEAAELVVALVDRPVRDRVWQQVDADPDHRWLALWCHLSGRALPPYRTEPLFLLAWTAWRLGDEPTARAALGGVRVQDPGHRAGALLGRMLVLGTDPRRLPSLAADSLVDGAVR
jgi:hypothetical protein